MLEIFIAFYASGVGIAMWQLWWPSYRIVKEIAPDNIMAKKPLLSAVVVLFIFIITMPILAYIILFDDKMNVFINGFVKGVTGINGRQ